jgi:hypothetical protein
MPDNTVSSWASPTVEALLHQIDELKQKVAVPIAGGITKAAVHRDDFAKLLREINNVAGYQTMPPAGVGLTGVMAAGSFMGIDLVISEVVPKGEALLFYMDGTFIKVPLRGPKPPPIPPYCDIVRLIKAGDGHWFGLDFYGERLAKFDDQTVRDTPWLNNLPR